jgi:hypothetical protein
MKPTERAWRDELFAEPFAALTGEERDIRAAAALAFTADPLAAVLECQPGDLDELEAIISWVNDPAIWGWPT